MAFDDVRGVGVLFGGRNISYLSDTWEWDGNSWRQLVVTGPSQRASHAMVYDSARGVTVLFGGEVTGAASNETWEWDGQAWSLRAVLGPSPRWAHEMAYDSDRRVTVLFGGLASNVYNDETWEWDGTTWTRHFVAGPSPRAGFAMAYDRNQRRVVLFGGNTSSLSDEMWNWDGATWTRQAIAGPSERSGPEMVFDGVRGVCVLFGGYLVRSDRSGETWELSSGPIVEEQPSPVSICPSGAADFSVDARGSATVAYQWQWQTGGDEWADLLEGDNSAGDDSGIVVSATGSRESGLHVRRAAAPVYSNVTRVNLRCVVSNSCGQATSDVALLTVCPADFDCDGAVGFGDYQDLVAAFEAGDAEADFTRDGAIDFFDYDEFVVAMEAGC
ncbi:MAG: hypothetical protein AABZ53_09895 [Planctomycetota bacterium]